MALAFLATKSWNPTNTNNQKALFLAQEKEKAREQSELEKALEIKKELKLDEERRLNPNYVEKKRVNFLYEQPPGYVKKKDKTYLEAFDPSGNNNNNDGLDEAARLAFSSATSSSNAANDKKDERYALQKEAGMPGRRDPATLGQLQERFEWLKGAPTAQGRHTSADAVVSIKPFGRELRNTKCARCRQWGHQIGDRECPMTGQLTEAGARQREREDPMPAALVVLTERVEGVGGGGGSSSSSTSSSSSSSSKNSSSKNSKKRKHKKLKKQKTKKEKKSKKEKRLKISSANQQEAEEERLLAQAQKFLLSKQ